MRTLAQACNKTTNTVSVLDLTPSYSLSPLNVLGVVGTLGKGLVADSQQHMFPFRSQDRALGQAFVRNVTLAGWGDCGGAYLRGPAATCSYVGPTALQGDAVCDGSDIGVGEIRAERPWR